MARGRMLDKVIVLSKKINRLSEGAENLYYRLLVNVDDYGRYHAEPEIIKGQIYTLRKITLKLIENRIDELFDVNLIKLYQNDDELYLEITDFEKHQTFRKDIQRKEEYPKPVTYLKHDVTKRRLKLREVKLIKVKLTQEQSESEKSFEKWWERYPRKEDKGKAKSLYLNLIENEGIKPQVLDDALTGYINVLNNNETPKQYVKHAKTFLYNGNKAKKIPSTWEQFVKFADPKYKARSQL